MAAGHFNRKVLAGMAMAQLDLLEKSLRQRLVARLPDSLHLTGTLAAALKGGTAAQINFAAERALPLRSEDERHAFHEMLVRLTDRAGKPVSPPQLFAATEEAGIAAPFRQWLAIAQVKAAAALAGRASVNVEAADFASPRYAAQFGRALTLSRRAGAPPLILEATENAPWSDTSAKTLARVAEYADATIAIDDYGARGEQEDRHTLQTFAGLVPANRLMVKLDGPVVQNFLAGGGRSHHLVRLLDDVADMAQGAVIVAERVGTVPEALDFVAKLRQYDHENAVTLVQDYRFGEDASAMFRLAVAKHSFIRPGP